MDLATLARLRNMYLGLTLAQRHHLQVIVKAESEQLSAPICEDLIELGLVRRNGNALTATEDGRFVASLF